MSKRTENALLSRGFDNQLASRLANSKITLSQLKSMSRDELLNLGISINLILTIHSEQRPPIPENELLSVLYKNRRTCCICRDTSKPIVVHHINEWAKSRDHSEANLAVLCLEHHDLAHTSKQLSQNLKPQEIYQFKATWEEDVGKIDAQTIIMLRRDNDYARWDWINIRRIFELLNNMIFQIEDSPFIRDLKGYGVIDSRGFLQNEENWTLCKDRQNYFIDFGKGSNIAAYLTNILESIVKELPIIDITPMINNKIQMKSLVKNGSYIAVQVPFYFSSISNTNSSKDEIKEAYYQGYGLKIRFTFQPWYCLSSSARYDAMCGRKVQTVFGFVRDISSIDGELVISLSCLGAGTAFKRHDNRVLTSFM